MKAIRHRLVLAGLVAASGLVLAGACSRSPTGPAQLKVSLVDAAPSDVDQIWVNITKVTAHSTSDGWIPVAGNVGRVDLLSLKNTPLTLGTVKLSAGRITQLRLYVDTTGNEVHVIGDTLMTPLKVPSGFESGIKILGPWRVEACDQTSVTIDFDGLASLEVHPTGTGDEWILRPVIKVKKSEASPVKCEDAGGGSCDENTACPEGQVCIENECVPGQAGGSVGSLCSGMGDCLSATCVGGKCAQSPPSGACRSNDDCTNHTCEANGSCAPCTTNLECPMMGQACSGGMCMGNL
ncbi:MAG TPA: DUF4382 domain-containing protein [Anaeromyxobacter sp.]